MPDTAENQLAYPQRGVAPGLGFPIMRAVGLISLATGAVVDFAFAAHEGKCTGESALLRRMMLTLKSGDVLVADRLFPSYFTNAMLLEDGVDIVSVSHRSRPVKFDEGHQLGERDHIATWHRPDCPRWMGANHRRMPETMLVREFEIDIENRSGGREKAIIVTTITDPTISKKEIADLYWARWNCELDIRSIKHALHMDILRCKAPEMIRKEIWCHLLAWNLLRGVMVESAKRNDVLPRQLSVKGTMQAVESFTPAMMAIDGNPAIYEALLATVSTRKVGNRPGHA